MAKLTYYQKLTGRIKTKEEADKFFKETGVIDCGLIVVSARQKRQVEEFRKKHKIGGVK